MSELQEYAAYFLDPKEVRTGTVVVRRPATDGPEGWLLFQEPFEICVASSLEEVRPLLRKVDEANGRGLWAAGFLAYDAGPAMDPAISVLPGDGVPLAWFGFYPGRPQLFRELAPFDARPSLEFVDRDLASEGYLDRFQRVKAALREGKVYQANLTYRNRYRSPHGGFELFRAWCGIDTPPFASYIDGGDWEIVSLSPELFVERKGAHVAMRPMKGTASRGERAEDELRSREFLRGPKTIAENLMIVDMVRNDLGRIARIGSVTTPRLMETEVHRNLLQVTSTVCAETDRSNEELIASVFPPASVTGAPKVESCRLISQLEASPRGAYCGTIGVWSPGGDLRLSVAIRTAYLPKGAPNEFLYGVGGGLVWDSEPEAELKETVLKLDPILHPPQSWRLVEAFHREASPERQARHWERLRRSAEELAVPLDLDECRRQTSEAVKSGSGEKVRIAVRRDGQFEISAGPSLLARPALKARLASKPSRSDDPNYRFKTNSKPHYREEHSRFPEFDEVLFFDEKDELTEFSSGNVVLRLDGELVTPSRNGGLLFGITVQELVEEGKVRERTVHRIDVSRAEQLYVVNAVVGMRPIEVTIR